MRTSKNCSARMRVAARQRRPGRPATTSCIADVCRKPRFDLALETALVLHDAGKDEGPASRAGHADRIRRALVGMDAAEEQQVLARPRLECGLIEVEAIVDGARWAACSPSRRCRHARPRMRRVG